jgi:hypothetical protein
LIGASIFKGYLDQKKANKIVPLPENIDGGDLEVINNYDP